MKFNCPEALPLITGSFLDFEHHDSREIGENAEVLRSMTVDDWARTLQDMHGIGIDTIIIRFSYCGFNKNESPYVYYVSDAFRRAPWMHGDLYTEVINEAERLGMKIFLSLGGINGDVSDVDMGGNAIERDEKVASELLELYGSRECIVGWYWTPEVPAWVPPARDYLKEWVPAIRKLNPKMKFLYAPPAQYGMSPTLLEDIGVDIIAYQDSGGTGFRPYYPWRLDVALNRIPVMFEWLWRAHNGFMAWGVNGKPLRKVELWSNLEIFDVNHKGNIVPGPLWRIKSQLELAKPFVNKFICFTYPILMCHPDNPKKLGGERAIALYEDYVRYREEVLREKGSKPWEIEWQVYGPIENPAPDKKWPGRLGLTPLELDGSIEIPSRVKILGRENVPKNIISEGGAIDFGKIFGRTDGFPIAYAITQVNSESDTELNIMFETDWGVQWWVNGKEVFNLSKLRLAGEGTETESQINIPLSKGQNTIVVRVTAGRTGWNIRLWAETEKLGWR